jgi:hypothetical protein
LTIPAEATVEALSVQVVEGDLCALVSLRRCGDDAGGGARLQPIKEEVGEEERCQLSSMPSTLDCRVVYMAPALFTSTSSFG